MPHSRTQSLPLPLLKLLPCEREDVGGLRPGVTGADGLLKGLCGVWIQAICFQRESRWVLPAFSICNGLLSISISLLCLLSDELFLQWPCQGRQPKYILNTRLSRRVSFLYTRRPQAGLVGEFGCLLFTIPNLQWWRHATNAPHISTFCSSPSGETEGVPGVAGQALAMPSAKWLGREATALGLTHCHWISSVFPAEGCSSCPYQAGQRERQKFPSAPACRLLETLETHEQWKLTRHWLISSWLSSRTGWLLVGQFSTRMVHWAHRPSLNEPDSKGQSENKILRFTPISETEFACKIWSGNKDEWFPTKWILFPVCQFLPGDIEKA